MATSKADELTSKGWQARIEGQHELAERLLLDAIAAAQTTGSAAVRIRALKALAHVYRDQDESRRAVPLYDEAVRLCRDEGDPQLLAHTVRHLGDAYHELGQREKADSCYAEALALYGQGPVESPLDYANALRAAGLNKKKLGDPAAARDLLNRAVLQYEAAGVAEGADDCRRQQKLL